MIVKALATPSGTRRRMKPLDTSFESSKQHCRTCTCNRTILSRREMLTRINFDSSSYSLRPRKVLETPRNSEVSEWQNNNPQEDYVKMSAKLVWMPKSTICYTVVWNCIVESFKDWNFSFYRVPKAKGLSALFEMALIGRKKVAMLKLMIASNSQWRGNCKYMVSFYLPNHQSQWPQLFTFFHSLRTDLLRLHFAHVFL